MRHQISQSRQKEGEAATVEKVTPGVWKVCLVTTSTARPERPHNFIDVLQGWGHTWLWNDLKVTRETDWIAEAIAKGTLVAVTDGSYIQEHHLELCAAASGVHEAQGEVGRLVP